MIGFRRGINLIFSLIIEGGNMVFSPLSLRKRILIGKKQEVLYT